MAGMYVHHTKIYQSSLLDGTPYKAGTYVHYMKNNRHGLLRVN